MSGRRVLLPVEMAGRRDIVLVSVLTPGRHLVNLIVSAELTNKPPVTRNNVLVSTPGYMFSPGSNVPKRCTSIPSNLHSSVV